LQALCKALAIRLKLSVTYHPQTDRSTEVFYKTLLTALKGFSNAYHTNWSKILPELLYAYQNTVHSATGFTPHCLLFGWIPRDLRAPLTKPDDTNCDDVEVWLKKRADQFCTAQIRLENARAAMIRARRFEFVPEYQVGDLVKVSTRVLPLRCSSTQRAKLQPKYIGRFTIKEKLPAGAYRLELLDHYSAVHDAFNCVDMRPWLQHDNRFLEHEFPHVMPHPSFDRVIQVLDRKRFGRYPANPANLLDIPAQYLVVRQSGTTEFVRQSFWPTRSLHAL
jgi:hypothetical protein